MTTPETMIPCTKKTRALIRTLGGKGETYDDILIRIARFYIEYHNKNSLPVRRSVKA